MEDQTLTNLVDCLGKELSKLAQVRNVQVYVPFSQLRHALFPGPLVSKVPLYFFRSITSCILWISNSSRLLKKQLGLPSIGDTPLTSLTDEPCYLRDH